MMETQCRAELCTPCLSGSKGSCSYVSVQGKRRIISGFTRVMQVAGAAGLQSNAYPAALAATCIEPSPGEIFSSCVVNTKPFL